MSNELMSTAEYQLHQLQEWMNVKQREGLAVNIFPRPCFFPDKYGVRLSCRRSLLFGYGPTIADAIADALQKAK